MTPQPPSKLLPRGLAALLLALAACDPPRRTLDLSSLAMPGSPASTRPCIANLSVQEGTFIDKSFESFVEAPQLSRASAFANARDMVDARGWFVLETNEAGASIRASPTSQTPPPATFTVVVREQAGGSRVEVSLVLHGKSNATRNFAEEELCNVLEGATGEVALPRPR